MLAMLFPLIGLALAEDTGGPPAPPVVNGDETSDYSAVGMILACQGRYCGQFCSATLIADRWVLTAAHCVEALDDYERSGAEGYFAVGPDQYNIGDSVRIQSYERHPDYDATTVQNDVGLLEIARKMEGVTPYALNTDNVDRSWVDRELLYVGYGITGDNRGDSGTKRYAWMPVVEYDSFFIYSLDLEDDQNLCSGDSGGASMQEAGGAYEVVGVNSFVFAYSSRSTVCEGGGAAVARVDRYIDWIEEVSGVPINSQLGDEAGDSGLPEEVAGFAFGETSPTAYKGGCSQAPLGTAFSTAALAALGLIRRGRRR
jgi:secreted trypsin-like serine protease